MSKRTVECLLCNREVGVHNHSGDPCKYLCPHGERCNHIQALDEPDCDKCKAERWQSVGDICRKRLGMQAQYGSRYVDGRHGYDNCGEGLRFKGEPEDYHCIRIHPEDVETFVQRVLDTRRITLG